MTFSFMDLVVIFGFAVTVLAMFGGILKFLNASIHARITEVKTDCDAEFKEIRDNYVHKDSIENTMKQLMTVMEDLKKEQGRIATRVDEFAKWVAELLVGMNKK